MVSPIILGLRRPFSVMFPTRSSRVNSTRDACAFFHSFLSQDLQKLEQSLARDASVSLRWSTEAMSLLKRMQIQLIVLFKQCHLPDAAASSIFQGGGGNENKESNWFNEYMQETAALLDFCNSLKSAISGINRYRMVVDLTVHKLAQGDLVIDLIEPHRVNRETVVIDTIEFRGGCYGKRSRNIDAVMVAARCTMMVISVLLVSAIVAPVSIDVKAEEVVGRFPELKAFVETLTRLASQFHGKFLKQRFLVAEHEMVDSVVGGLKGRSMNDGIDTELLWTTSDELREGILMFDAAVDEVFDVVVKGRNEMLGVIRDGVLTVA